MWVFVFCTPPSPVLSSQKLGDFYSYLLLLAPGFSTKQTKAQYEAGVGLLGSQWEECATTIASDRTSHLADSIRGPNSVFSHSSHLAVACGISGFQAKFETAYKQFQTLRGFVSDIVASLLTLTFSFQG